MMTKIRILVAYDGEQGEGCVRKPSEVMKMVYVLLGVYMSTFLQPYSQDLCIPLHVNLPPIVEKIKRE